MKQTKITDKRLANLKPAWKTGQSGNPAGRPVNKDSITYWYKQLLSEGLTAKEVAEAIILKAREGSLPHAQEVTNRTDGTLIQRTITASVTADAKRLAAIMVRDEIVEGEGYYLEEGDATKQEA